MTYTPITQAERDELRRLLDIDTAPFLLDLATLTGLLDALDEADAVKATLGVLGAPHERALEVAGSIDGFEEQVEAACRARTIAELRAEAAERKVYDLKSRICDLDCRYTMGDVADISGSHCDHPCARCLADRDRHEVEAERDALKAKLAALVEDKLLPWMLRDEVLRKVEEVIQKSRAAIEAVKVQP